MNVKIKIWGMAFSVACLLLAGCGDAGPEVAPVYGVVTLDGAPLAGADVTFTPESGRPSYAVTDDEGEYHLAYKPGVDGAVLGRHSVQITTGGYQMDDQGNTISKPEQIPKCYNEATILIAEVTRKDYQFDYDLKETGE